MAFTAIHQLLISNIWSALLPMLVAGALCGASIAWSYHRLFRLLTVGRWVGYNLLFVALLALLGLASLVVFDPVVSIATLLASKEPPRALIGRAMPMTIAFAVVAAVAISAIWGRRLGDLLPVMVSCLLVVGALGLNISILGLVYPSAGEGRLLAEVLLLVLTLAGVFALSVLVLSGRRDRAGAA